MSETTSTAELLREFDPQTFLDQALAEAGASGFDDTRFIPSMRRWLHGAATEGRLSEIGVLGTKANIARILANRLRMEADIRAHPEIFTQDVSAPIFVIGIPRTGTTKLQRVLSNDPTVAPVPLWRLLNPAPLPGPGPDQRLDIARAFVDGLITMAPDWQTGHPTDAEWPDEETFVMEMAFDSVVNCCRAQSRYFREWWLARPKDYVYEFLRTIFRYWQWQDGGDRSRPFVGKSPDHTGNLDMIAEYFPDAVVVHCHRDPVVAVPSGARLIESMLRTGTDHLDLVETGEWSMSYFADALQRNIAQRDRLGDRLTIVDVRFDDIVRRPGPVAREVHRARGRELTEAEEAAIAAYDEKVPHRKTHSYSLERYSITEDRVREAFGPYIERFGEYFHARAEVTR